MIVSSFHKVSILSIHDGAKMDRYHLITWKIKLYLLFRETSFPAAAVAVVERRHISMVHRVVRMPREEETSHMRLLAMRMGLYLRKKARIGPERKRFV